MRLEEGVQKGERSQTDKGINSCQGRVLDRIVSATEPSLNALGYRSLTFSDSHILNNQTVSCLAACFLSSVFCMSLSSSRSFMALEQVLPAQKLARLHLVHRSQPRLIMVGVALRKRSGALGSRAEQKRSFSLFAFRQLPNSACRHLGKQWFCLTRGGCSYLLQRQWV